MNRSDAGQSDKTGALRERLDDVGSVFEYVSILVDQDICLDMSVHKRALSELYEQIMVSQREWYRKVVGMLPLADYLAPNMVWDLSDAAGSALTQNQIHELLRPRTGNVEPPSLYDSFCRTLWLPDRTAGPALSQALFAEWVESLGLVEHNDVVVFDWTSASEKTKLNVSAGGCCIRWSNFFSPIPDSQRVWCLTIWNPVRRTIAALAACRSF